MSKNVKEIREAEFKEEVLGYDGVYVIDFFANWCGPCRILSPVIDELAVEFENSAKFGKIDVDQAPSLAMEYGVMSVPCVIVFYKGKVEKSILGAYPKNYFQEVFKEIIAAEGGN